MHAGDRGGQRHRGLRRDDVMRDQRHRRRRRGPGGRGGGPRVRGDGDRLGRWDVCTRSMHVRGRGEAVHDRSVGRGGCGCAGRGWCGVAGGGA